VPVDPSSPPALSAFPRVPLFDAPTPLHEAPRLSSELGAQVLVKRDDLTVLGLGGNKVRKLEYLLGRALADGCDTIVTFGALQSNHARQTAAACVVAGLRCELVLTRAVPRSGEAFDRGGNVALDHLFGATVTVVANDDELIAAAVSEVTERIAASGGTARWIPPGGSDAVGTLGYVAAGMELGAQVLRRDRPVSDVVVAVSTGGTHAGLLTGLRLAGSSAAVHGACVYKPLDRTRDVVERLLAEVADLLGRPPVPADEVHLDDAFLGDGYGLPGPGTLDALRRVARTEGLVLDPVYTGKAAEALIAWAGDRRVGADGDVVFVHTGGAPGLGAYPDLDLA
jgi:D-cysteine desulfhydrase family pyridoxal phosphate-dependent enzyme